MVLLELQELDTKRGALNHRLDRLPGVAELAEQTTKRRGVENQIRDLRIAVADLSDEQKRADVDVEQVKTRRDRDQGMVDSGAISDPKALERMLGELESLARRISTLEDVELEVMERLEQTQTDLAAWEADLATIDEQLAQTRADLELQRSEIAAELEGLDAQRVTVAGSMPADLLEHYERIRDKKGGVGAAILRRKECQGCGLMLNAAELAALAKAPRDEVQHCDECGRILVITSESGL